MDHVRSLPRSVAGLSTRRIAVMAVMTLAIVFSAPVQAQSNFRVLYSFKGTADGKTPSGQLVRDTNGNLYGITSAGGANGLGTIFKLDSSGHETVLYSLTRENSARGSLTIDPAGNLYGTWNYGGPANCNGSGCGTVFELDTSGKYKMLHSFAGGMDGQYPSSGLVLDASGNLYGTTQSGGVAGKSGTIFKISSNGQETVLYRFSGGMDGQNPAGPLVRDTAGNLYGATRQGGISNMFCDGCGIVFKLDAGGHKTTLHNFTGGPGDSHKPRSGLVRDAAGNLYGIGEASVFQLAPNGPPNGRTLAPYVSPGGVGSPYPFGELTANSSNVFGIGDKGIFKAGPNGSTIIHPSSGYAWVTADSAGNIYGVYSGGGPSDAGYIFELTH